MVDGSDDNGRDRFRICQDLRETVQKHTEVHMTNVTHDNYKRVRLYLASIPFKAYWAIGCLYLLGI